MRTSLISTAAIAAAAIAAIVSTSAIAATGASDKPKSNASAKVKPLGNEKAPQGGTFLFNLGSEPTTLNPITSTDGYSQTVRGYVMDSLMERNEETYAFEPALAEKFEISKDGKEYTFTLRTGALWSDGKPVTVEDVKFSFDVIFDDKYAAANLRPYYENIEKAEIINPTTIKFTTKSKYFGNFDVVAGLAVVPKHVYGNAEEGKKKNKSIVGSGPYVLKEYNQGQSIILERNKNWWGNSVPEQKGRYNFQTIRMRFDKEENLVLERLKKGELHFDGLTPEAYTTKTEGAPWGTEVLKKKVENSAPKQMGFIGWNMKRDLFMDKKVRRGLAHMMNREEMNKKFRYGMSIPQSGPWYMQSEYANPAVKAIPFDTKKAVALFKDAGWTDSNKDGVLDKDGKPFEFTLFYASKDTQKYWVMYQEDLKKVGVKMNLQLLEWNAFVKNLDERNFDAVAMAWGGGSVDLNPKQIWHSDSMKDTGSNFVGYSNPKVDKMIDEGVAELDKQKRIQLYRKIYAEIAEDAPYAFLFVNKFELYAVNKQIGTPKDTNKYAIGYNYWWMKDSK